MCRLADPSKVPHVFRFLLSLGQQAEESPVYFEQAVKVLALDMLFACLDEILRLHLVVESFPLGHQVLEPPYETIRGPHEDLELKPMQL